MRGLVAKLKYRWLLFRTSWKLKHIDWEAEQNLFPVDWTDYNKWGYGSDERRRKYRWNKGLSTTRRASYSGVWGTR